MVEASHVPFCPTKTFMQGGAPKVAELQIRIHSVGHRSVLLVARFWNQILF